MDVGARHLASLSRRRRVFGARIGVGGEPVRFGVSTLDPETAEHEKARKKRYDSIGVSPATGDTSCALSAMHAGMECSAAPSADVIENCFPETPIKTELESFFLSLSL
jgi:hypothetical protein